MHLKYELNAKEPNKYLLSTKTKKGNTNKRRKGEQEEERTVKLKNK